MSISSNASADGARDAAAATTGSTTTGTPPPTAINVPAHNQPHAPEQLDPFRFTPPITDSHSPSAHLPPLPQSSPSSAPAGPTSQSEPALSAPPTSIGSQSQHEAAAVTNANASKSESASAAPSAGATATTTFDANTTNKSAEVPPASSTPTATSGQEDGWTAPETVPLPASIAGLYDSALPPYDSASHHRSPFGLQDDFEDDNQTRGASQSPSTAVAAAAPQPAPPTNVDPTATTTASSSLPSAVSPRVVRPSASSSVPTAPTATEPAVTEVRIVDAHKAGDAKGSGYIVYVIRATTTAAAAAERAHSNSLEAARRYSEFEAFRQALVRLYPVHLVPPIPDKHSLTEYAIKQARTVDDVSTIARRRRMLQSFLQRLAAHPILGNSSVFSQFLNGRLSWNQIATSPPLSQLPRTNLRAPTYDVARVGAAALPTGAAEADLDDPTAFRQAATAAAEVAAYDALPLPPATTALRQPDTHFLDAESFTDSFTTHLSGTMEKINRRLEKRWQEAGGDAAELGAVLNGFALTETGPLARAIERCGQASDATYQATSTMLQEWQTEFSEPLHEYAQYGAVLQKVLQWRHVKQAQVEAVATGLEARRAQLEQLQVVDVHTGRLTGALQSGGRAGLQAALTASHPATGSREDPDQLRDGVNSPGSLPPLAPSSHLPTHHPSLASASIYGGAAEETGSDDWVGTTSDAASTIPTHESQQAAWGPEPSGITRGASSTTRSNSSGSAATAMGNNTNRFGTSGLLGALSHTLSSMLDVDPEGTRRSTAARLRGQLAALEGGAGLAQRDLSYANQTIQADLDRFQRNKVADFRQMLIKLAQAHRNAAAESLEAWQEAQQAVEAIPAPPGMPQSSLVRHQRQEGSSLAHHPHPSGLQLAE